MFELPLIGKTTLGEVVRYKSPKQYFPTLVGSIDKVYLVSPVLVDIKGHEVIEPTILDIFSWNT